jgi:5-methylcytosine-specific restriction endonuclease McrA|uniref:NinG protein n=1 Tax=Siphoviridae sp. ctf8W5 TaxID=2825595 RepID=A0A8S5Q950_9CAUD|nr:MAG TPA: NinG protein [Siphoviridae sp. ctf8W5]
MSYEEILTPEQIIKKNQISTAICEEVMRVDAQDKRCTDFYNSKEWKRARAMTISRDDGIDIWEYMKTGRVQPGNVVHHIVSVIDNPELKCTLSNLVTVSPQSHREIEKLYNKGNKQLVQSILQGEVDRRTALFMPQPQPPVDEGLGEGESYI